MHNTLTALLKITCGTRSNMDRGHATILVLLDFSKAFHMLDWNLMCVKFEMKMLECDDTLNRRSAEVHCLLVLMSFLMH